jgi:hypothetical protein
MVRILSRARVRGASLLLLGGCATGQHAARQSRDYPAAGVATVVRGYYHRAFEVTAVLPCPGPGVSAAFDSVRRAAPGGPSRVDAFIEVNAAVERSPVMAPLPLRDAGGADLWFVVWRGRFSPPGLYGSFAASQFEFTVDSVLDARPARRGDCDRPARGAP